jgi:hypothetical protein
MPVTIPNAGVSFDTAAEQKLLSASGAWNADTIAFVNGIMAVYIDCVAETAPTKQMADSGAKVFTGAHVRVAYDEGILYHRWSKHPKLAINSRYSSHASDKQQYEVVLKDFGSVLFGVSAYGVFNKPHTWFQAERTSADTLMNTAKHTVVDFTLHKASGNQQVGQLGYSEHSEKKEDALLFVDLQLPPALLGALKLD